MTKKDDGHTKNLYDHLKAYDVLTILKPLLDGGSYKLRTEDGKVEPRQVQVSRDTPWIHVKQTHGFDCGLWHQITFNAVVAGLPEIQKFVPRHCQECWKVVVKPRSLKALFNLLEMQKKLDRPSKCGIEIRESVPGLYGGYFYNKSFDAGMKCYLAVKAAMLENEFLAPLVDEVDDNGRTTRVLLKRACTEYEHLIGDSSLWEITPEQEFIEDLLETYIAKNDLHLTQPEHLIWNIKRRWIEWAWKNGDTTYSEYTGGKPLYPDYVTFHQPELIKGDAV